MKPVDQTCFSGFVGPIPDGTPPDEIGNCLQAAFASILELPLDRVPHFAAVVTDDDGAWWWAIIHWLEARGFGLVTLSPDGGWKGLHLLSGKSPRGDFSHTVVARGGDVMHDPHPSRAGVESVVDRWILVPLDPTSVDLTARLRIAEHE